MSEKWWDMSDDELDDLFREASDKAEIPFDSSALDKLRQKIDFKPLPESEVSLSFMKRWIVLAGLLIFVGVALVITFFNKSVESKYANIAHAKIERKKELKASGNLSNNQKSKVLIDKDTFSTANGLHSTSAIADIIENKIVHKETLATIENFTNRNGEKLSQARKNRLAFPINKTSSNLEKTNSTLIKQASNNSEAYPSIISHSYESNRKKSKLIRSKVNNNQLYNPSGYPEINTPISTALIIPDNKPTEEVTIVKTNFYNVDFITNKEPKPLQINVESDSPTYIDAPPIAIKQPKFLRFGVRLAIAPEINSIERMESSAVVGNMFALLLEYRLTKKLTLQTGVNYSKKKYSGDFEYYHAWTSATGTQPLTVDGICNVVDIPINLRLNAFQIKRNTFFISGGVSSYLMSDEIYTYNYAWGSPKVRDWTGSSSSFYWSTLNLSAGVERKMNKHFTLQVEPFLKTPLVGLGRGLVNLYSSGLLFSTKYEF